MSSVYKEVSLANELNKLQEYAKLTNSGNHFPFSVEYSLRKDFEIQEDGSIVKISPESNGWALVKNNSEIGKNPIVNEDGLFTDGKGLYLCVRFEQDKFRVKEAENRHIEIAKVLIINGASLEVFCARSSEGENKCHLN